MDADNVPLADPTDIFFGHVRGRADGYADTGFVVWPDYWESSAAPDLFAIFPELKGRLVRSRGNPDMKLRTFCACGCAPPPLRPLPSPLLALCVFPFLSLRSLALSPARKACAQNLQKESSRH